MLKILAQIFRELFPELKNTIVPSVTLSVAKCKSLFFYKSVGEFLLVQCRSFVLQRYGIRHGKGS